jgi:alkanesulfonate monooxygenase SsuD/methylene tetrahydromethanopterin reductase-like flavin-dependent oxidoreductase (luciferase family)
MAQGSPRLQVGIYLPQVQFTFDEIRDRVLACEAAGIDSVWFMDHLYPPGMPAVPSFEAWTLVSALATLTRRIRLGHLVLSNSFRHPALLARMASTLDAISAGLSSPSTVAGRRIRETVAMIRGRRGL